MARFFVYDQNNSGGSFVVNSTVAHYVIIEAESVEQADRIAEDIGIYFNGCDDGSDCPCCGDRWYRAYGEGCEQPEIYGTDPIDYDCSWAAPGDPYCYVYYLDGVVKTYRKEK